ncbi:MAG: succinate dehydrogenase cytochrome b subunit [Acidobacteria bacterium]|nr:succinate dehydrogenase cytochrome b subunit [Acidobacteriota bacterium]
MRLLQASASSIGSKIVIALTGLGLAGFLITHLAGNLLFLVGPEAFNEYSHKLISNPLIYAAEIGLLGIFFLHIAKTVAAVIGNKAARPTGYAVRRWAKTKNPKSRKSVASSSMIATGTIVALFVVTHLATFKFGTFYQTPDGMRDLYRLQLEIFSNPAYVLFYLVAMGILFFHLWHGLVSAMQSLGLDHPQWTPRVMTAGRVLAVVLAAGFFIIPIYTFVLSRSGQ